MSPRPRQNTMLKTPMERKSSRKSTTQYLQRTAQGTASVSPPLLNADMPEFSLRSRSDPVQTDESFVWNGTFSGHFPGHDDSPFDSLNMDTMPMVDNTYMVSVVSGSHCYDDSAFDQFSQGPMSQTLTVPLLDSSYQDVMISDDVAHVSSNPMDLSGYNQTMQHTWRHGQLSPPAEIFTSDLSDFSADSSCDMSFQALPESAILGSVPYDKNLDRLVQSNGDRLSCTNDSSIPRLSQPRPIRCASERRSICASTMAPQDIHYTRSDRADKVKARNDPRYDSGPDTDGYYHCPMLGEGSCTHKPTKQKCIYAKYLDSHLKPYVCTHGEKGSECDGARFSSNACLFRHEREAHGMHNHGLNPYLCLFPGCERSRPGNGFPRRWNQRDHMKRVHDWEEPETSGFDNQDRAGPVEPTKRRRSSQSHSVQMKRSSSSHSKAQAATYAYGSRHSVSMSRYAAQAEKHLQAAVMVHPMQFNDVQFSPVSSYQPPSGSSESYPHSYLVAY